MFPIIELQNIRFACIEEIAAMKADVICRGGRKKDFWDVHDILETFSLSQFINCYKKRYPFGYTELEVVEKLIDFSIAEDDFTPICLKDKDWEIIKLDIEYLAKK